MNPVLSSQAFSLASDPGIPSANTPRVETPMPAASAGMGSPVNRSMYQNFRRQTSGIPMALSAANIGSSTYSGG